MNRKQEIAAWIFGVLIAFGLLATDNDIWALVVLAGLTILSLRDRQKKKWKPAATENTSQEGKAAGPSDQPLKHLTPHLLAIIMLQRRAEGAVPFREWKKADVQFPAEADAMVALSCECYQLRIFLDVLQRRFGSAIAKMVENSFSTIMDAGSSGIEFFARANAAILRARDLGPTQEGPNDPELRLDLQVADQLQAFSGESDENKAALRLPLAHCLGFARISAQAIFPDLVTKMDFDPASIALVPRGTAYKGITNRWSCVPGCFERHLQRKEGNFLFPIPERQPSDEALKEARARDQDDLEKLEADVAAFTKKALLAVRGQKTIDTHVVLDLVRWGFDPLIHRAAEIGDSACAPQRTLQETNDAIMKIIADSHSEVGSAMEVLEKDRRLLNDSFFAQTSRKDTPIASEELILALLCESTDTVKQVLEIFSRADTVKEAQTRDALQESCRQAIAVVAEVAKQGFELPGAEEKLALLKACAEGAESTATA